MRARRCGKRGWGVRFCLVAVLAGSAGGGAWPAAAAEPAPPETVTEAAAALEPLLAARLTPAALADILRWMLRHNHAFTLELAADIRVENRYSHPALQRLRYHTQAADWRRGCRLLSAEEQFRLYCLQRSTSPRSPFDAVLPAPVIYRPVDFVPTACLFTEPVLLHALQYLVEHPAGARYDGIHGRIAYTDPLLAKAPGFVWRFLREHPAAFRRTLAGLRGRPLHPRLLADTFTEDPGSRIEPYDHLCARLQTDLAAALAAEGHAVHIDRAALRRFCRQVADNVFEAPPRGWTAPPVAFGHNGDPRTRSFDFLCVGEPARTRIGEPALVPPGNVWVPVEPGAGTGESRFIERLQTWAVSGLPITYGVLDLLPGLDKADVRLTLDCAAGVYDLSFEVEQGAGSLPAVPDALRLDQAAAAREINVVFSFSLVPTLSDERFRETMDHLVRAGFLPVAPPAMVADLWEDFRKEVGRPNTSLVVPVYHVVDQERFRVGWNQARKLVLRRRLPDTGGPEDGIRWIRLAAYAPPADPGAEEVLLRRAEFSELFRERALSAAPEDTLCLMNMSCFSQYTVESWMAAFREAVRDLDPAAVDPMDIPFLIGARHGLDAEDPYLVIEHMEIMLEGLLAGRTRSRILAALAAGGRGRYDPVSNAGRPDLLRMGGSFRLRVSAAEDPAKTAGF